MSSKLKFEEVSREEARALNPGFRAKTQRRQERSSKLNDLIFLARFSSLRAAILGLPQGSWFWRFITAAFMLLCLAGVSLAAGIKVVPSAPKVTPGESFYADVVVEDIPAGGLGAVQFRLNVSAPGSTVAAVSDAALGQPADVSVSSPLIIGSPTAGRSGIGDFFLSAKGSHGILVMENETLQNGSGMYTLGHTSGASLPSGSGPVARFRINPGSEAAAEKIVISLSDVALLEGGNVYPLDSNTGATVDLKCYTQVPSLIGLSAPEATAALTAAKLALGTVYEIDNSAGTHTLNTVLAQSAGAGTTILCETPVDLAINTPPGEVSNFAAADKTGDESGTLLFSWTPSPSSDAAGYRFYNSSGNLLTDIADAAVASAELSGLVSGQSQQFRITVYDTYGNESAGVSIAAAAVDDVAPRIAVSGVTDGAYYASDVQPVISVQEANPAGQEITLNGIAYNQSAITLEDAYLLRITATDTSGNSATKEIGFTIDKTPPVITVAGIEKNRYYNTDLGPAISVTDANLETVESSLNGSAYTSGTIITAENDYELQIQAVDKAGNSTSDAYTFHIDKTKPMSAVTVGTPKYDNEGTIYVGSLTAFTLSGTDAGVVESGVDRLEYRANSETWSLYQAPVTLAGLADGSVSMYYRAVDRATNIEDARSLAVTLDSTPPVTTLAPGQPQYVDTGGTTYVTQNTTFTLSAMDALSGVALTEYRVDSEDWTATVPFTIAAEGAHTILYHSRDNLENLEVDRTFTTVVDNTPPVTTITTGDPKHTAGGNLYVTGSTAFTLSAADNLSGIAETRYRIDGGTWTEYAPFTIPAEGTHTIEYFSKDNATNTEAVRTLTVIVDNTAPVSTITAGTPNHQFDGKLYVAAGTGITITVQDASNGVKKTEYSIDNGNWNVYTAMFTLGSHADGSHTIRYRSVDNVNNTEAIRELVVILDKTAPQTSVTTSDQLIDGVINTVSPATFFTLTSEDALSGVRSIAYRINNGTWQGYTGSFSLAGMEAGEHTITFKATDNVLNDGAEKSLTVRLIVLDVIRKISADSSVLIGAWPHEYDDHDDKEDDDRKGHGKDSNSDRHEHEEGDHHNQHEKGYDHDRREKSDKNDHACSPDLLDELAGILITAGITHYVPADKEDFITSFRSGRFNTYILLNGDDCVRDIEEEIREAVHYGSGVISIKTRPDEEPGLDDVFGVSFKGRTTHRKMSVDLLDSPISNEGTLRTTGKGLITKLTTTTAESYAVVNDKHRSYPAIVHNTYGRGNAVLFAFDLLSASDKAMAAALLINSINHVRPLDRAPGALASLPIRIKLDNSIEPAEIRIVEYLPEMSMADGIFPEARMIDNTITWDSSIKANENLLLGYRLNLPDIAGSYPLESKIFYSNFGDYRLYGTYPLELEVTAGSAELLGEAVRSLETLGNGVICPHTYGDNEEGDDFEDDDDDNCSERLAQAIRELNRVDADASDRKSAGRNIERIQKAINMILKLKTDVSGIRLTLDELLRVWERKWYLAEE